MKSGVNLISNTPMPEKICDSAARLSQVDKTGSEIYNTEYPKFVIPNVIKLGHKSVAEHAYFNFVFENVSVFVEHFMIEFRLASFTVKSRRYVDFRKAGFTIPDYLNKKKFSHLKKKFISNAEYLFETYSKLVDIKIPAEDARFILPYCFKSNFFLSMNARELMHAIYSMIKGKGSKYKEIKSLGESMLSQLEEIAPSMFNNLLSLIKGNEDKWKKLNTLLKDNKKNVKNNNVEILSASKDAHENIIKGVCSVINTDYEKLSEQKKREILNVLISDRRARELELANFVFSFNNISYPFLTHFIRHRIHSPVIPPFEYTGYESVVTPHTIKQNRHALEIFNKAVEKNVNFNEMVIKAGVPEEYYVYSRIAGNVLNITTSMNARELYHFFALRTCERAQWEIREYAQELLIKLKKINPLIFQKAGPGCVLYGICPEGKMSCGKIKEKQEFYNSI